MTLDEVVVQLNAIERRLDFMLALLPREMFDDVVQAQYADCGFPLAFPGDCVDTAAVQEHYAKPGETLRVRTNVGDDTFTMVYWVERDA